MKDVFKIIVSFLYDEDLDLEVRTASLYTLYAFYCHQLSKYKLKVLFCLIVKCWENLIKFTLIEKDSNLTLAMDLNITVY
jgi:hypothetical protein